MDKSKRQAHLVEIIQSKSIASQDALMQALKESGVQVGQATISRDMRELGVSKKNNAYYIGNQQELTSWERVFQERIHHIEAAGPHMLVVKGLLGCAPIVSVEVESMQWPEIVGVIAGDDTLFFAFRNEKDLKVIEKKLLSAINSKK